MHPAHHPIPLVGQNRALLPDASLDPAHASDCGETCASAVLLAFGGPWISPGCVRQAFGKPMSAGYSTAQDIAGFLEHFRLDVAIEEAAVDNCVDAIKHASATRGLTIELGYWLGPSVAHWRVTGKVYDGGVYVMDPWYPAHLRQTWDEFAGATERVLVTVHAR